MVSPPPFSSPASILSGLRLRGRGSSEGAVAAALTAAPRPRGGPRPARSDRAGGTELQAGARGSGSFGGARDEAGEAAPRRPGRPLRGAQCQPQSGLGLGLGLRAGVGAWRSGPGGLLRALLAVAALHEAVPGLR